MNEALDYESGNTSQDDDAETNYVRPILIKKRIKPKKNKIDKGTCNLNGTKAPNLASQKHTLKSIKLNVEPKKFVKEESSSDEDVKPYMNRGSPSTSQKYREFGEEIAGFKYVVTEQEYHSLKADEAERELRAWNNFAETRKEINDMLNNASAHRINNHIVPNEKFKVYWNSKDENVTMLPFLTDKNLVTIDIDEIEKGSILKFYKRSSSILGIDLKGILKDERIKWHPDKISNVLLRSNIEIDDDIFRKITKTFQIINDLWIAES